jgi:hypothetical protein
MITMLAQIPETLWPRLIEIGLAAPLIWWITNALASKLEHNSSKIDDNTWATVMMAKTQLISLVALGQLDSTVKKQAEGLLQAIEKRYPDQNPPEYIKK